MLPHRPAKLLSTFKEVLIGIYERKVFFLIKGTYQIEGEGGGGIIMARSSESKHNKKLVARDCFKTIIYHLEIKQRYTE